MARLSAVSARRVRANRRNAKKSTGPKTAQGKARSSRNAITHGIFCSDAVVQDEDRGLFETLRAELIDEHKPQTITELFLVDRMAVGMWRLRRTQAAEEMAHAATADEMLRVRQEAREDEDSDWSWDDDDDADVNEDDTDDEDDNEDEAADDSHAIDEVAASVTTYGLMVPRDGQRQATLERLSLYEKRIEGTVHRCLRDLRKLRTPARGEQPPQEPSPWAVEEREENASDEPLDSTKPLSPTLSPLRGEGAQAMAGEGVADAQSEMKNEPILTAAPGEPTSEGRAEGGLNLG